MILKEWIYQIIVFLILAAIIDLLIPSSRMQKYVRLAVGMIMMLIFLKPVFYLFNTDIEQLLKKGTQEIFVGEKQGLLENQLEIQKREILGTQQAYISKQMAVQLKEQANPTLREMHRVEIASLDLEFADEDRMAADQIDKAVVVLREAEREGAVAKVEHIAIGEPANSQIDKKLFDEAGIREALLKEWNLNNKQLTVLWEGGTS